MSREAEAGVLGACMIDDLAFEVVSDHNLTKADFGIHAHALIWEAISDLAQEGSGIDLLTVGNKIESRGQEEQIGGLAYLQDIIDMTAASENAGSYAKIIKEGSNKRQISNMAYAALDMLPTTSSEELQDYISCELMSLGESQSRNTAISVQRALRVTLEQLDEKYNKKEQDYYSGLTDLDDVVKIEGSRVTLVGARPGMGKSALVNVILRANLMKGIPCMLFTMEMPATEATTRLMCAAGSIDNSFFKDPASYRNQDEVWPKVSAAANLIKTWPLEIDEKASPSVEYIRNRVRGFLRKQESFKSNGKALICIDYLGLMKMSGDNRTHAIGKITKAVKGLAQELCIPVILLHQLNRGLEGRPDKRPVLSDLRDSGEIEEDVDHAIMLYRDEVYNEDSPDKGTAELIVRKNRTGENNKTVRVASELKYYDFRDIFRGDLA